MFVVFHFHLLSQYDGTALTLDNERFMLPFNWALGFRIRLS
jgi:hypothetical protein